MAWELSVWPANKSGAPTVTRNTDAVRGIDDGFEWQLTPYGGTVQLRVAALGARLRLPPLGIVKFTVNGEPAFYGQVPDPSHQKQQDVEEQLVLGGREVLRRALMDGKAYRDQGVFAIVRDLLGRLCPPGVTYDPALIGNGSGTDAGPSLSTYYAPTSDLATALDTLAKAAGVQWDVDVQGRVFFGRPQPAALTVAYAGKGWGRLRVQGRETVTRAVLRVVTAPAGLEGGAVQFGPSGVPATVTVVAQHAQHDLYRAERAVEPPQGVALIAPQPPERWVTRPENVDGTAALDNDPTTYTAVALGTTQRAVELESALGRPVGVEVEYTLPSVENLPSDAYALRLEVGDAEAILSLQATAERRTLRLILPPDAGTAGTWRARLLLGATLAVQTAPATELRVYAVRFLVVDETASLRVAQSFLQLPFATPAEVTLPGLVAPTPTLTVTGSPDGDVTGATGLWEYQYTRDNRGVTLARLGSDGQSDTARAIKFAVQGR